MIGSRMKYRVSNAVHCVKARFPLVPIVLVLYVLYAVFKPRPFAVSTYEFVSPLDNLATAYELESSRSFSQTNSSSSLNLPSCLIRQYSDNDAFIYDIIRQNYSSLVLDVKNQEDEEDRSSTIRTTIVKSYFNTQRGGEWSPSSFISKSSIICEPIQRVAIIVPYKNRPEQLKQFLLYIHPFLQLQMIHYKIFIIDQVDDSLFNRGKLLNIGYTEALKENGHFSCLIFHDVDLLPENLNNLYACTHKPRHMSAVVNTFRYTLQYEQLFGGATSILPRQFKLANGYSNNYQGWGGEDDDMFQRVKLIHWETEGSPIVRFSPEISSYRMIPHTKRKPSEDRFDKIHSTSTTFKTDGLNNLKYKVIRKVLFPLYTLIQVQF